MAWIKPSPRWLLMEEGHRFYQDSIGPWIRVIAATSKFTSFHAGPRGKFADSRLFRGVWEVFDPSSTTDVVDALPKNKTTTVLAYKNIVILLLLLAGDSSGSVSFTTFTCGGEVYRLFVVVPVIYQHPCSLQQGYKIVCKSKGRYYIIEGKGKGTTKGI